MARVQDLLLLLPLLAVSTGAWMPCHTIRGVSLGALFVFEPWLAEAEWARIGCGGQRSEFDCVMALGQTAADAAFQDHWDTWIARADITEITRAGLNTVRIPVGYWLREDIVYADSEHFPRGALPYLERLCGWAADAGLYIIIDLHAAPGAQVASNPFTGQYAPVPGFYVDWQYERALKFLEWITTIIHTNRNFRNVGMLQVVNEPERSDAASPNLRAAFYPSAVRRIRAVEAALRIDREQYVHIQMMNKLWGPGDPVEFIADKYFTAFDDHRYLKWADVPVSHADYIATSCSDDRGGLWPTIVGEFSLSVPDDVQWTPGWHPSSNKQFYKDWFAAQIHSYEKQAGWVFWTWKSQLGDYRWSYRDAVLAGVIPPDLRQLRRVCDPETNETSGRLGLAFQNL
ncbi:hypothetical protein HDU82_005749 [Entophlyctis luteolus]|nr:hypothetical protein HDU82_005749 [Entophlyctis luteolus]